MKELLHFMYIFMIVVFIDRIRIFVSHSVDFRVKENKCKSLISMSLMLSKYSVSMTLFCRSAECTWSVEIHTRRSTLLEISDKYKVNVCSCSFTL